MNDIEWACKWVGAYYTNGIIHVVENDLETHRSINDLAEAVRVKFKPFVADHAGYTNEGADAALTWIEQGPEAFINAVREVVDD